MKSCQESRLNPRVRLGPGATGLQWLRSTSQPCNPLQVGRAVGKFLKQTVLPFSHLANQDHERLCPWVAVGLSEVPSEMWRAWPGVKAQPGVSTRCWNCCYIGPSPSVTRSLSGPGWSPQPLLSESGGWFPLWLRTGLKVRNPFFSGQVCGPAHFSHSGGSQLGANAAALRTTDRQTDPCSEAGRGDRRGPQRVPEGAPSLPVLPRPPWHRRRLSYTPLTPAAGRRDPHPSPLHLKRTNWALLTFSISQQPCRKKLLSLFPDDRREPRPHQRSPRERPWKRSRRTPPGSTASPLRRSKEMLP